MPEAVVEPKPSVTVVTSENLLEFQNKKIDEKSPVAEEPEPEAEVKDEKKAEPVAEEEKDEDVKQVRKGNPKIEKRFSELTEARKAAEAKAKQEQEARAIAERERDELKAKYEAPKTEEELGPEPKVDQFANVDEYSKALKEWTAESTKRDLSKESQAKSEKEQQEKRVATWKERLTAAQKDLPDFSEKIANSQVKVSDQVRDEIIESEVGPQLLYHLSEHPEVAERIGKLTVGGALRELGKLEAKLEKSSEKEPENPVTKSAVLAPVAEVSKAPAPIAPLRGAGKPVETRIDSNGVYHGTYSQYKKDRAAGKIK